MATLRPVGGYYAPNYGTYYTITSSPYSTGDTWRGVFDLSNYNAESVEITVNASTSNSGYSVDYPWSIDIHVEVINIPADTSKCSINGIGSTQEHVYSGSSGSATYSVSLSGQQFSENRKLGILVGAGGTYGQNITYSISAPSVNVTGDNTSGSGTGTTTPTQQKITITARPGQPSGNSVAFADGAQFTWSISSIPEDRIYQGTQIQFTDASDVTGSHPIFDRTIDGLVAQYNYTSPLSPNSDYIWRAKAVLKNYSQVSTNQNSGTYVYFNGDEIVILQDEYVYEDLGGSSSTETETTIETPWSDWQTFHTKDYEQVSVTVTTSSPENNASFVHGKQISFRWSINGGSGVTISSSTIMVDGTALTTINGTGTSYTLSDNDAKMLSIGTHTWYVTVDCSANNSGSVLVGSPESNRNTLYIGAPVATANPSSPSGSTTVKGNAAVQFSWSISKNGDGDYTGSELEWRYSNESSWRYLGKTQHSVTTFTYESGFAANRVVQWRVRTSLNGAYGPNDGWSEPASFTVGDIEIFDARPNLIQPKGTVKGDGEIVFAWTVDCQTGVSGCIAEYSTDGGITWSSLGQYTIENGTYIIRKRAGSFLLPAGSVEWRVSAAGNGDYGNPVQSSFTVSYEAYGRITTSSAYINSGVRRDQRIDFNAALQTVGTTSESITFSDASFCWKMANSSEYAEEPMTVSGDSATISFIANKFPAGVLLWYLKAHDSKNNDSETIVYSTYILKSGIDTFVVRPIPNVYETTNQLDFEWGFIAQNKELSNGTEIRFSFDGYAWEDPIPIAGRIRASSSTGTYVETNLLESLFTGTGTFTLQENYFSAGRIKFQVRSKSSDGIIGEWSEESQFVMRGLPKVGDFACDAKPFATFTWTANEQVSYEILLDDEISYGPFHGTEKTFTLPEPLQDGPHTAALRVQNSLSLFGEASEISFNVLNESSAAVPLKLRVEADVDANLFWAPIVISDDNEFLVYCDDRLIARLPSDVTTYCDRLTLGAHTYTVYQRLTSGNYDIYMHSPVEMHSDTTRLSLYEGGPWIGLVLTTDPYPVNTYTHSRAVEKTKIFGTKYPVVEISDFEEATGSYEVCWPFENYSQMKLFDTLVGSAIIIKSRADQIICGVLESCSFDVNSQFIKCTFQLDQMSTDVDLSIAMRPGADYGSMTNLDKIYFGQMTDAELDATVTNPGYTDPRFYEEIAEAINERLRAAHLLD